MVVWYAFLFERIAHKSANEQVTIANNPYAPNQPSGTQNETYAIA
jgi:hypothetical protein